MTVYTIAPAAQQTAASRFVAVPEQRASADGSCRHESSWLPNLTVPLAALLDLHCCPIGLWSVDRSACLLNDPAVALLGYCVDDFRANKNLWLERVERDDQRLFLSSWKSLQGGETRIVCRYRFMPKDRPRSVALEETALLLAAAPGGKPVVLSLYRAAPAQDDCRERSRVRRWIHQIGNHLQAIRGEADLLRLLGGLPQRSFDTITQGVDSVQALVAQIDHLAAPETFPITAAPAQKRSTPVDDQSGDSH